MEGNTAVSALDAKLTRLSITGIGGHYILGKRGGRPKWVILEKLSLLRLKQHSEVSILGKSEMCLPPRGTCLRTHYCTDRKKEKKPAAQIVRIRLCPALSGIELGSSGHSDASQPLAPSRHPKLVSELHVACKNL